MRGGSGVLLQLPIQKGVRFARDFEDGRHIGMCLFRPVNFLSDTCGEEYFSGRHKNGSLVSVDK